MRLTQENRIRAQQQKADFLARTSEVFRLDQSPLDQDPEPNSVILDKVEFEQGGVTHWRTAQVSFSGAGAVLKANIEDKLVTFEGEKNDLYGYRTLTVDNTGEELKFQETYTAPIGSQEIGLSSRNDDGKILSFDIGVL